ncbi:MAG: hypothetical protein ACKOC8_12325 [Pirellulales bacterium]
MHTRRSVVGLGWLLALTFSGCSTGPYDRDLAAQVERYRADSEFAALSSEPTALADGRVTMRLPASFAPIEAEAAFPRPPFIRDFPGFAAAFDVKLRKKDGNEIRPVLTVGVVATAESRHPEVEQRILDQAKNDVRLDKAQWQRGRQVQPIGSGSAVWDTLSLGGEQEFEAAMNGELLPLASPATCEIWVSADPKQEFATVIALRVPAEVADQLAVPVPQVLELMARSVEILPAAEPPAAGPEAK